MTRAAETARSCLRAACLCAIQRPLLVHRLEEVVVGLGVLQLVEQELHRVGDAHRHQDAAHRWELALVLARPGGSV